MCQTSVRYSIHEEPDDINFIKVIKIPNFRNRRQVEIISDGFNENNRAPYEWTVDPCSDGYVSVLMKRSFHTNYLYRLKISCIASVVDSSGRKRFSQSFGHHEGNKILYFDFGLHRFVSRKELFEHSDELLPNDTLTLVCQVSGTIFNLSKSAILDSSRKRYSMEIMKKEFIYNLKMWIERSMLIDSNVVQKHNTYFARSLKQNFYADFWKSPLCTCAGLGECPCSKVLIDENIQITVLHCYLEFLRLIVRLHDSISWDVIFHTLFIKNSITKYALNNLFHFDFIFHDFANLLSTKLLELELPIRDKVILRLMENTVLLNAHDTWLVGKILKNDLMLRCSEGLWEKAGMRFIHDITDVYALYEKSVKEDDFNLKNECLKCLRMYITIDTVEGIFQFARKQNEMGLLYDVAKFIFENESEILISGQREIEKWFLNCCDFANGYIPVMEENIERSAFQFYE